jgi:hypothetical protein
MLRIHLAFTPRKCFGVARGLVATCSLPQRARFCTIAG